VQQGVPQRFVAVLLGCLMAGLVWAACNCGFSDGRLTLQTINVDGNMADWGPVLADPDNNVCDGPINSLIDRDAPVQSNGRDLVHFAFTWDATNLYLFTERIGSANNVQRFVYYADTDNDGLMETTEPVVGVNWNGNTGLIEVYIFKYKSVAPGGDPMTDGMGFADGYTLPGSFINVPQQNSPSRSGFWGAANGLNFEFHVSWAELGVPAGSAITFHVSSANAYFGSANYASQIDDNLSGCGGGLGGTQFAALSFWPDHALSGRHGETVIAPHTISNDGNGNDTFEISYAIAGDHTPAVTMYLDVDGSGDLSAGDTVLTDTDGDGSPDIGQLAPGQTATILMAYQIASNTTYDPSGTATITVTATSSANGFVNAVVVDTVDVILDVELSIRKISQIQSDPVNLLVNPKAIPQAVVDYIITTTNLGGGVVDADSVVMLDTVPAGTALYVGDYGVAGSGPVEFTDGTPSGGMTYTYVSLGDVGDDLAFSDDGGVTFTYTPVPDADGFDSNVTHLMVTPKGTMPGASAAGNPSFELKFRVRVL